MKAALWALVFLVAAIGIGLWFYVDAQNRAQKLAECQEGLPFGSVYYFLCEERYG
jgi:hypothetical protein